MEVKTYFLLAMATLTTASVPDTGFSNELVPDRQRRSFEIPIIGSLFGGEEEPEIPHLGQYPLWKVHRYHGISLQPIPLPEEDVLLHPVPPTHDVEAPSIVNVPDPHYAPKEQVPLPPNEYGPPASPSAGPYPSPSAPSGPYPLSSAPTPQYPSQSSQSGPYSPASPPSAPYSPVFNAQQPPEQPRGHTSSHAEASSVELPSPGGDSHFGNFLSHLESGGNIEGGLGGLLSVLPSDVVQKLQEFISTPEGRERISAIIGLASNAKKLKVGATRSLQDIFSKFFGGAGGSSKVALQSGTYTNIPHPYPEPQGLLNSFSAVGTGVSGSILPTLPELPDLPEVPGLGELPPTPKLPHINLPATSHLVSNSVGGQYVSISLPESPTSYGVPDEHVSTPADSYAAPPNTYGLPAQTYGPPAQTYGPPAQTYGPPAQTYGPPAQTYEPPAQTYGPPAQTNGPPAQTYGPPAQTYGPPAQTYGPPAPQIPLTSYGVPAGQHYSYQPPSQPAPQFHSSQHNNFDHATAASDNHEDYQSRDNSQQESEVNNNSPVPLQTTKLHPVHDSQAFQGEDLRRYLDVNHPASESFKPSHPLDQEKEEDEFLDEGEK